jgi:hypothetical protein
VGVGVGAHQFVGIFRKYWVSVTEPQISMRAKRIVTGHLTCLGEGGSEMKKILVGFVLVLASMNASAAYYTLVSCEYKYVPEYGQSVYVGLYKSSYGNYFTRTFNSYCPASISD